MITKYRELFESYLRACKRMYDPEKPYDNLEPCIKRCEESTWKLAGMIDLMAAMGKITAEDADREFQKVTETFSSIAICRAYMDGGEVMVFRQKA